MKSFSGFTTGSKLPMLLFLYLCIIFKAFSNNHEPTHFIHSNNSLINNELKEKSLIPPDKLDQTITFPPMPEVEYGDAPFDLTAASSSGLPVVYTSSNLNVATINGNKVTITGVGETNLIASQPGNSIYNSSPSVVQKLTVVKANQIIFFNALPAKKMGDTPFNIGAEASSRLPLTFTSSDTLIALINGASIIIMGAGECEIIASQSGNTFYNAALPSKKTFKVSKGNQAIYFDTIPKKTYGDKPFWLPVSITSSLSMTITSSDTSVALIQGKACYIRGAGITTITASHPGNKDYNVAAETSQNLTVKKANQTIDFKFKENQKLGDPPFELTKYASSGLTVTYVSSVPEIAFIDKNMVTIVGAGVNIITASQKGNKNINPVAPVSKYIFIEKAHQTITFDSIPDKIFGDKAFYLDAKSSARLTLLFESSNENVAIIDRYKVEIVGVGETIIKASQYGDINYYEATAVSRKLVVHKSDQNITFDEFPVIQYNGQPLKLKARSSSGLQAKYHSSNPNIAEIKNDTIEIKGIGNCVITATQEGDGHYNKATEISRTLTIVKGDQEIIFNLQPVKLYSDSSILLNATSSSGLSVNYKITNPLVALVQDNNILIKGVGTTNVIASQPGNNFYNAAKEVSQQLIVNKADQKITFEFLPSKTYGDKPFEIKALSTSKLTVLFESSNPAIASINGNIVTIKNAGDIDIIAYQTGNEFYNPALEVIQKLTVIKADQTITFLPIDDKTFGNEPFQIFASSNSGLPVRFKSSDAAIALVTGATIKINGTGSVKITAYQPGDNNYNPAVEISEMFTVKKNTGILKGEININDFNIYPNPTEGKIYIQYLFLKNQKFNFELYNPVGKILISKQLISPINDSIDLSSNSKGIYILKIKSGKFEATKEIILK